LQAVQGSKKNTTEAVSTYGEEVFFEADAELRRKKCFLKGTVLAAPYFPHIDNVSNIGEERLNFCVRDGNRCTPLSKATKTVPFMTLNDKISNKSV
jgi:hypothetical protein